MDSKSFFELAAACVITFASSPAAADDTAPSSADLAERAGVAQPSSARPGRGLALGVDNGLFGRSYEQGLRLRIPLLDHLAINLRGVSVIGDRAGEMGWYAGGRAELMGHSPVYLNLVRIYGSGGPEVVTRLQGGDGDRLLVGGGGQLGFEFFVGPRMSFFAEIGGHSGDAYTGGGTAVAGLMLYPFSGN